MQTNSRTSDLVSAENFKLEGFPNQQDGKYEYL